MFMKYDIWDKMGTDANVMQKYIKIQALSVHLYQKDISVWIYSKSSCANVQKYLLWKREDVPSSGPLNTGFFFHVP